MGTRFPSVTTVVSSPQPSLTYHDGLKVQPLHSEIKRLWRKEEEKKKTEKDPRSTEPRTKKLAANREVRVVRDVKARSPASVGRRRRLPARRLR
ncbi:hypothetical protein EVAR_98785_1 [Eumeta japonica]|uniref:Uncharacterized protein n=1 Tax=Eumeta variegata TaxID=151549 RepID=A0A4C1YS14_EUMVA|nr:hypothetical protein EVAR_98785_1 [Eumeta japonica]